MQTNRKIALAGSTGYLGLHIIQKLLQEQYSFVALARNVGRLEALGLTESQIANVQVTVPGSLHGVLDGMDTVISSVGITRQKDGLTYMDVDYQANMNLLDEAMKAGVNKFIYVSAINGRQLRHLKIMEAKERFVDALHLSGMKYTVLRPNGFFSDMKDFLDMARKGRVYLFGDGDLKLNPIHGADLAQAIVELIDLDIPEVTIGGPDLLTQNEIAEMALQSWGKPVKIVHIPDWVRKSLMALIRMVSSQKTYGPLEFFLTAMALDHIAPRYGIHRLKTFFAWEADRANSGL